MTRCRRSRRSLVAVISVIALLPLGVVIGTGGPAAAAVFNSTTNFNCRVQTPIGDQFTTQTIEFNTTAPNNVYQGSNFTINATVPADPAGLPGTVSGQSINHYKNFYLKVPIPANSTYVNVSLSGGFGLGPGTPTVSHSGGVVTVNIPGPIPPNQPYQFPTVNLTLNASGPVLSNIQPKIGGTSFSNPGFGLVVNAALPSPYGNTDMPVDCFPTSPVPALSTTQIWPVDNDPPTITITTPADGAIYALGSTVNANYSCSDGPYGVGVAFCNGPVPNGSPIDTATAGTKTFTVNAQDLNGLPASKTHTYQVVDAPAARVHGGWADEGGNVTFTISLSRAPIATATLDYSTAPGSALAGSDYTTTTGTLVFTPTGSLTQTVTVPTVQDTTWEQTETFDLAFSNPSNIIPPPGPGTGRIRDDDPAPLQVTGGRVTEGPGASITFEVALVGHSNVPVTVNYTTSDLSATAGADYAATSGTLAFNPGGPLAQTVVVPVLDDSVYEDDVESFTFTATNPGNGDTASARGNIEEKLTRRPTFNVRDITVVEGDQGSRTIFGTVTLDKKPTTPVGVLVSTVPGTATPPADYVGLQNQLVDFKAGQVHRTFQLQIKGDTNCESDETFSIVLSNPNGGTIGYGTATVTILNDDCPTAGGPELSVVDYAVVESDNANVKAKVTVTINTPQATDVTFKLKGYAGTATSPLDYKAFNKNLTLQAGKRYVHTTLTINGDTLNEGPETFTAQIENNVGAGIKKGVGTVTIVDNDDQLPSAPANVTATTAQNALGAVRVSWDPATPYPGWPITTYEYRVSTNGGPYSAWAPTGAGDNTAFTHACGQGNTCDYEIRARNKKGPGPFAGVGSAVGLADTTGPAVTVESPMHRANVDRMSNTAFSGDAGIVAGDTAAVTVEVFGCADCTNPANLLYTLPATVTGGSWTATAPVALADGVYTVVATQTDWNANQVTTAMTTFETRNAVFVAPQGSDANPGSAAQPKLTVGAAISTATSQNRPQVAVGQGTYAPAGGVSVTSAPAGGLTILGGFAQGLGWARGGTAGAGGSPDNTASRFQGQPQGTTVNGAITVTLDNLTIRGLTTASPGTTVYGVRVLGGANVTLNRSVVIAEDGQNGSAGTAGTAGGSGTSGGNGGDGGNHSTTNYGGAAGTGPNNGGAGGRGGQGSSAGGDGNGGFNGGNGVNTGAGGGGGGAGKANCDFGCETNYGGDGQNGGNGSNGANGTTVNYASTLSFYGTTYNPPAATSGTNGTKGTGGGGGGGGPAACVLWLCPGNWQGGGGGAGGGGGGGNGTFGTAGTAGGGSFAVYAHNSTVTVTGGSSLTAGKGGNGGTGGLGGDGGTGGGGGSPGANGCTFPLFGSCSARGGFGGTGGNGGKGGNGGSGAGGPSVAAVRVGSGSITITGGSTTSFGTGGANGSGSGSAVAQATLVVT